MWQDNILDSHGAFSFSKALYIVGILPEHYMMLYPRRPQSAYVL
jgi:hypothetical protein